MKIKEIYIFEIKSNVSSFLNIIYYIIDHMIKLKEIVNSSFTL